MDEQIIVDKIHSAIDKKIERMKHRDYLGASSLGEECERKLWYTYHRPKNTHTARSQMIFDFGHMTEDYAISILKDAFEVWPVDPTTGEQFGFVDGSIAGHCDGFVKINNEVMLLEIKSMNQSRFNAVKKYGLKEKERAYWIQMQIYMAKIFDVKNGLFFAMNKNTCDLHTEIIPIENDVATTYIERGKQVIASDQPFQRKYSKISHFKCRMCNYKEECWNEEN